ncbi:MAG: DUF4386 family protein [Deltaproteobacteria bacterium]|nr:DUF4386 family protein [Deltaproteobacteria bacterium]
MVRDTFRYWRLCAWAGPLFLVTFVIFWGILGRNIPPLSPASTEAEVARHFIENANRFRLGFGAAMTFAVLYFVWTVAIFVVMQRMEGDNHVLSYLNLTGGLATVCFVTISCSFWLTASFRPEREPAIQQLLYDLGWLTIDMCYCCTTVQMIAMSVLFLTDQREEPLFPKWLGWYTIWVAFIFFVLLILPFVKTGPFAWNGMFNFWVAFFAWFIWIQAQSMFVFKAITRLEREAAAAEPGAQRSMKPSLATTR